MLWNDGMKIVRSIRLALKGFRHAYRGDKSFRMEVVYGFGAYLLAGWYFWPMTHLEFALFVSSYLLILIIELINTAIETMLNRLHPGEHELIGRSKDISAAAVLASFVVAALIFGAILYERLARDDLQIGGFFKQYADYA